MNEAGRLLTLAQMVPYQHFAYYMASVVIVRQHVHSTTHTEDVESLRLIMNALRSLQQHWKMTDSSIMQLSKELRDNNIDISIPGREYNPIPINAETSAISPPISSILTGELQQS